MIHTYYCEWERPAEFWPIRTGRVGEPPMTLTIPEVTGIIMALIALIALVVNIVAIIVKKN